MWSTVLPAEEMRRKNVYMCVQKKTEGIRREKKTCINNWISWQIHWYEIVVSPLTLLREATFHTPVILDPGVGPCIYHHGDNVLVPSTRSKRQYVFACWPKAHFQKHHLYYKCFALDQCFLAYSHSSGLLMLAILIGGTSTCVEEDVRGLAAILVINGWPTLPPEHSWPTPFRLTHADVP